MSEIKNLNPSSAVLSQYDYTYYADGKVHTWQQQTDSNTPLVWTEGYDAANQLTSAVLTNTAIASPAVRTDSYAYDASGNPSTFNISGVTRTVTPNALNQITGSTPSGNRTVGFTGLLNCAATVTVSGTAATVNGSHYFSGTASLTPGTTATVPVVATDAQGNRRTNNYQTIVPAEPSYSPTFDNDGNELTNGAGQSYTWDAKNELATITQGSNTYAFGYDTLGHRISETDNGTLTKQWVWDGSQMVEERNASNVVIKRFFAQGEQISGTSYYYTRDHLGSVREMSDSSGAIQARYDYDPFGRATKLTGSLDSDFRYAGYYEHGVSGLNLTLFRAYDPNLARWLSRDPIGENGGINLYGYVLNDPVDSIDPLGLCCDAQRAALQAAKQAFQNATNALNSLKTAGRSFAQQYQSTKFSADAITAQAILSQIMGATNNVKAAADALKAAQQALDDCENGGGTPSPSPAPAPAPATPASAPVPAPATPYQPGPSPPGWNEPASTNAGPNGSQFITEPEY